MMNYVRIDPSEEIDVNKSSRSKECMLCHYWYFLGTGYTYEPEACNGCHDISMMVYELKDIAILNIKCFNYWCIICICIICIMCIMCIISRSDTINRLNNPNLDVKG